MDIRVDVTVPFSRERVFTTYRDRLSDLAPHESLVMRLQGAGAPGTIAATSTSVCSHHLTDRVRSRFSSSASIGPAIWAQRYLPGAPAWVIYITRSRADASLRTRN